MNAFQRSISDVTQTIEVGTNRIEEFTLDLLISCSGQDEGDEASTSKDITLRISRNLKLWSGNGDSDAQSFLGAILNDLDLRLDALCSSAACEEMARSERGREIGLITSRSYREGLGIPETKGAWVEGRICHFDEMERT